MNWAKIVEWICQDWVQEVAKALLYMIGGAEIVILSRAWKESKEDDTEKEETEDVR